MCTTDASLSHDEDAMRGMSCAIFVVPRGDRLLARVFIPLPPDTQGGERFDHDLDAAATRVLSVRYEQ